MKKSTIDFFGNTLKVAQDMVMSVGGRDAARVDNSSSALMTVPCIVAAIVSSGLLGTPTSYLMAHEFWHELHKNQVKLMHRTVSHSCACDADSVLSHNLNVPCAALVATLHTLAKLHVSLHCTQRKCLAHKVLESVNRDRCAARRKLITRLHIMVRDPVNIINLGADVSPEVLNFMLHTK